MKKGAKGLKADYKGQWKALYEHKAKLPTIKYTSQVESTIRNITEHIKALEQVMIDYNIPIPPAP